MTNSTGSSPPIDLDITSITSPTRDVPSTTKHLDFIQPLISDNVIFYVRIVFWGFICLAINLFGVVANIINMVVFIKIEFHVVVNTSFFAVAIADLGSCCSLILSHIVLNPWFRKLDYEVEWDSVIYVLCIGPRGIFVKATTLITALITFQRCICVIMPLKVNTIFTRKRVVLSVIMCYALMFVCYVPLAYSSRPGTIFRPDQNRTFLGLVHIEDIAIVEAVISVFMTVLTTISFGVILISTMVLAIVLMKKAEWRSKATAVTTDTENTNKTAAMRKEYKTSKMVISVAALFIICFLPTTVIVLVVMADRRIGSNGPLVNMFQVLYFSGSFFESINSSMNIFIYYTYISKYKAVFDRMFFCSKN